MWWRSVDPDDTSRAADEPADLDWFVDSASAEVSLDSPYPLNEHDELWIYERSFRRVSGLAHVVRTPYRSSALAEQPRRCLS
jgi:hypothetical protein